MADEAEALDALAEGDVEGALAKLQHAVQTDPENHDARLDLVKLLRDFDSRFALAQLLLAHSQFVPAMDELLEILMRDKSWNEDLARKTHIAILDIIEPPKPKVAEGQVPPEDPTVGDLPAAPVQRGAELTSTTPRSKEPPAAALFFLRSCSLRFEAGFSEQFGAARHVGRHELAELVGGLEHRQDAQRRVRP